MRFRAFSLLMLLLLPMASGAFQQISHKLDMTLHQDGSARVLEEYLLYMDSDESSHFYDSVMSLNDISAWKNVTSPADMRIHMDTRLTRIDNMRIRAQRRDGCNAWTGTCYGIVRLEYDVSNAAPGSFIIITQSKPRTYNYSLNAQAFSFGIPEQGTLSIPKDTELVINLPPDSVITRLNPFPSYFTTTALPMSGVSQITWSGPIVLTGLELEFTREEPLETEMIAFFRDAQRGLVRLIESQEGLSLLLMIIVILASLVLLRKYTDSQAQK